MSKKTFFDAIQPHILKVGDELTKDEFKALAKKTDEIGEKYAEKSDWVFESVPLDEYYLTANPYNVVAEKKALVEFHRRRDDVVYIPKFLMDKPQNLSKLYQAVVVKDKVYATRHQDIVMTRDTERYMLMDDVYQCVNGQYYENNDNLVQCGTKNKWVHKDKAVRTADMGYYWFKNDTYKYMNEEGETEYYRYREMAPDAGRRIIRYDEVIFPKPEDIKESRIGIELEYMSAIDASKEVLLNPELRRRWSSVRDGSLIPEGCPRGQEKSTEFVSVPFKLNEVEHEVKTMIKLCKNTGARITEKCGYHVHIGSPDLNFNVLTSLVLLCQNMEDELFRLMPKHRRNNEYCRKIDSSFKGFERHLTEGLSEEEVADIFYEGKATAKNRKSQSKWNVRGKRHYWLSVDRFWYCKDEPHKRTVEFRMHHATHDADEFLQFVLLCYYITQYAINNTQAKCNESGLMDILESINNHAHEQKVRGLLQNKKVISN